MSPARNDVERLFDRLVQILASRSPGQLREAIPVSELYEQIVPYRTNRSSLQFDTNEDYEMAMLRLLAGERGLAAVEQDEVREALATEARAVNPTPGAFRAHREATVRLDVDAVRAALGAREAYAPPVDAPPPPPLPPSPPAGLPACAQCDQPLPSGRTVLFCPFCGGNVGVRECPDCGTTLERDWHFCITCGKKSGGPPG